MQALSSANCVQTISTLTQLFSASRAALRTAWTAKARLSAPSASQDTRSFKMWISLRPGWSVFNVSRLVEPVSKVNRKTALNVARVSTNWTASALSAQATARPVQPEVAVSVLKGTWWIPSSAVPRTVKYRVRLVIPRIQTYAIHVLQDTRMTL